MSNIKKHKCEKCGYYFSSRGGNYQKHINVCDGSYLPPQKSKSCKHCDLSFAEEMSASSRANHTRWCVKNPKRQYSVDRLEHARKCRTEESWKSVKESIKKAHAEGKYKEAPKKAYATKLRRGTHLHSEETKQLMRERALASPHRRLKKNTIEYKGVLLDSSWELELAKRLDDLGVKWVRPEPIPWVDGQGVTHNYFPDFYLEDYDLFLDPKNPQAIKVQKKKLDCLLTQYKNIIIIDSIEDCKTFTP